ncbi:hypothetical protein AB0M36_10180 [Actinoplanes sp. NPDC051346]|uniref:hypothetical protein n=1 Tax=Actinoplanes sp. NPDC051346 TaxID=3155048 RepID=UPI003443421D
MTPAGSVALQLVLSVAMVIFTAYVAGRVHQWYRHGFDRDVAYREGYNQASHTLFQLAVRNHPVGTAPGAGGHLTAPPRTAPPRTAQFSTAPPRTAQFSTAQFSTAPVSTAPLSAAPLSAAPLSAPPSSGPFSSASLSSGPLSTAAPSAAPFPTAPNPAPAQVRAVVALHQLPERTAADGHAERRESARLLHHRV